MQLPDFQQKDLLKNALTHRSALNEGSEFHQSNERLEFLGDAVLELATTEYLYHRYPDTQEGLLTAYRSALVKTTTLAEAAMELGVGEKIFMSKGEEATGGRENASLLADTMEAIIGALYLDQGYDAAAKFLEEVLFFRFDDILKKKLYKDAKSHLQEVVQAQGYETPIYEVVSEVGPDHDKEFTVRVLIGGQAAALGTGRSKQLAQQDAARKALERYE
jgi:ribonuclease-3